MTQATFLPVLIPLLTAIVLVLLSRRLQLQRVVCALSTLGTYGVSLYLLAVVWQNGIQVYKQGDWVPPFGITLVADLLSCIMVGIAMTIATAAIFYLLYSVDEERERFFLYPLFQVQLMGVNGCFLTGDIFNLFVFFEVMLIASYALVALGGQTKQIEATVKYMVINLISSTGLVCAVGLLYGLVGTLNMADIAQRVAVAPDQGLLTPVAMLFLFVFGLKAALFALWFWMPGTYTVIPAGLAAYFGGILTKVGVYGILRVFTLIFNYDPGYTHTIILVLAGLTMFFGVLGAAAQDKYRTILTYHISSQVGYMIMGVGIFTVASVAGTIYYIVHHILVKSALFLSGGVAERLTGRQGVSEMGGLASRSPLAGVLFLIAALSLAGFPPLSGFFAKLLLIKAGLEAGGNLNYTIVAVSLLVSVLTLYSMAKIWQSAYWGKPVHTRRVSYRGMLPSIGLLVALCIVMGLYATPFMQVSTTAAEQLMNPQIYIDAVLGGG
ncbi:proton-conducting transporter membrane subunit [Chloroflexota bacterium]